MKSFYFRKVRENQQIYVLLYDLRFDKEKWKEKKKKVIIIGALGHWGKRKVSNMRRLSAGVFQGTTFGVGAVVVGTF